MSDHGATAARGLGYAGLIPFVGLSLYLALNGDSSALMQAYVGYSALILSFLGGIRWGLGAQQADAPLDVIVAVSLSLWAWAALLMPYVLVQLSALALGHLAALLVDGWMPSTAQPVWLRRLRLRLSTVAITCHLLLIVVH